MEEMFDETKIQLEQDVKAAFEEPFEVENVTTKNDLSEAQIKLVSEDLTSTIEAIIFAAPEPISAQQIQNVLEKADMELPKERILQALQDLEEGWSNLERPVARGFELIQIAGGYMFRTRAPFGACVRTMFEEKPQRLSTAQLEVLAVVAYRQPVTRIEIEDIRGVDCSNSVKKLLQLGLIKILGKSDGLGRPLLYGTSKQFLEFFAINSLHDLPSLNELKELSQGEVKEDDPDGLKTFRDLFTKGDKQIISEDTERLSEEALRDLEQALEVVGKAAPTQEKV